MPLRDHFRGPLAKRRSWEELHGAWPSVIAMRLNRLLPEQFYSGPHVHLGTLIEVDVATFDQSAGSNKPALADPVLAWEPAAPTLLLETEAGSPPEYEIRVYDMNRARRLVAVVELVSPGNKDRPESRDAFVSKCHALLLQDVCVAVVDPVTDRAVNLFADLADRLGAEPPTLGDCSTYAVACRRRETRSRARIETWEHELRIGEALPTLPLWLSESRFVPLELEATYEETCRGLRMA